MDLATASLIASIVSVVLAVVAIWIAFHQKNQTDRLLNDIKAEAKIMTQYGVGELQKSGDFMRSLVTDAQRLLTTDNVNDNTLKQVQSKLNEMENELKLSEEKAIKSLQSTVSGPANKAVMLYPDEKVGQFIRVNVMNLFGLSPDRYGIDWWIETSNGTFRIDKTHFNMTFGEISDKRLKIIMPPKS